MKKVMISILLSLIFINYSNCSLPKNIYSFPDLSQTSGKFNTFMIDFKGIKTPISTFWSLCNWQMDLTEFRKTHEKAIGGGAQGGFQKNKNGQTVVLSLWDILYQENKEQKSLKAKLIYPEGAQRSFKGKGKGRNIVSEFKWQADKWYRFVIKSWKDEETGNTFVGEWVEDIKEKKWILISYFDTNLKDSFIIGSLSQFQESLDEQNFGVERSFQIKNIYAYDIGKNQWISLDTAKLYYDPPSSGLKTEGTHEMKIESNYFYASSGLKVENQEEYDEKNPKLVKGKINQNKKPDIEDVSLQVKASIQSKKKMNISWVVNKKKCPAYSYKVTISKISLFSKSEVIHTYVTTRPEQNSYTFKSDFNGIYTVSVEALGLFEQASTHFTIVKA